MVTKRTLKLIKSLQLKKYRKKYGLFVVEGNKVVTELLQSDYKIRTLIGTAVFMEMLEDFSKTGHIPEIFTTDEKTLSAASHFQHNNAALAVVEVPPESTLPLPDDGYIIALDDLKDPGNLGAILRIADWYGIRHIVCSPATTDLYNPKVISASMGSFLRVTTHYQDLKTFFQHQQHDVYAAYAGSGQNVHRVEFTSSGIILMGSESHGISKELEDYVDHKINIPLYGKAESLNVSVATGIICDNIMRFIHE